MRVDMVKSWDCFDTLLGRTYHYPRSIFSTIGNIINNKDFRDHRISAEKNTLTKTLEGIYGLLPGYSKELEIETEKQYTFPIKENFDSVEDGDIVVSDMYLSSDQILDLLRYHGMNKDITVYSSYGGKASGKIWDSIKQKHNIDIHIGDNLQSDVVTPRNNGIKTFYYHGSNLSYHELLIERYSPYIAYWSKHSRLSNIYYSRPDKHLLDDGSVSHYYGNFWIVERGGRYEIYEKIDENNDFTVLYSKKLNDILKISSVFSKYSVRGPDQRILWTEQASFNLPILIVTLCLLPKNQKPVFVYRDCVYMAMLYEAIYNIQPKILHSSRSAYNYPYNDDYKKYLVETAQNNLLVDLHGTGNSSSKCFTQLGVDCERLFVCEHCNAHSKNNEIKNLDICFHSNAKESMETTRNNHNSQASRMGLRCCRGTVLEKFNISPNLGPLAGWVDNQPFRKKNEHDSIICETFYNCIKTACSVSKYYKDYIYADQELLDILLDKMNENTYVNSVVHSLWGKK